MADKKKPIGTFPIDPPIGSPEALELDRRLQGWTHKLHSRQPMAHVGMTVKKPGLYKGQSLIDFGREAIGHWSRMKMSKKASLVAIAAVSTFALSQAFGRRQDTINANLPYNRIPGQQASRKIIDVPWGSPWEGIATDERSALDIMTHSAISATTWYAFYNSPALIHTVAEQFTKFSGKQAITASYSTARFLEDLVPFRVGRFANISSYWSSFMTPDKYNIGLEHLSFTDDILTDIGRRYAGIAGASESSFLDSINMMKRRGVSVLEHTKIAANSPYMRIRMDNLGPFDIRMFDLTSRLGNSFASLGVPGSSETVGSFERAKRVRHILGDTLQPGELGLGRRLLRGLHSLFPNAVGGAVSRWASVPQWDRNAFMSLQKTQQMASTPLLVPGYKRGQKFRALQGISRDYFIAGYTAVRQQSAIFGLKLPAATSTGSMVKGMVKAGWRVTAAMGAFAIINNSLNGALTSPFFNLWERAMLARASFSDATGLTRLREQMPNIQTTAVLGILGAPLAAAALYKYGSRVNAMAKMSYSTGTGSSLHQANLKDFDYFRDHIWGKDSIGKGVNIREQSYKLSQVRSSAKIKSLLFKPEMYERFGDTLSAKHYMKWKNMTTAGKGIIGIVAGATALMLPFLLGSKNSREELEEIYGGERKIEVKRGRWWELGSTPYEGGRTHYYRRHQIARRKLKAAEEIPGGGSRGIGGLIKSFFNPYWREQEAYDDRPYPMTGGTALADVPLIGPLLDMTIGRWLKPPKLMHTDEWRRGDDYEQYGGGMAPSPQLGGLPSPTPRDPSGLAAQIREATYRATELAGLRGYLTQAIGFQATFGGDMPFEQAAVMQPARLAKGITDSFWERDMGGMGGINEIFRRLFPRPERGTEVNPLRNQMPSWLPGDEYFINFKTGDPYSKVRYGAERLPGGGYETLNPEVQGLSPENYPSFHKYRILADVAPWAMQTRSMRGAAYAEAQNDPARLEELDRVDRQVEQIKERRAFKRYSFLAGRENISGKVSGVDASGRITLTDYPHHTFTMEGINLGSSAVADQLRRGSWMTKAKATQRAFEARDQRQSLLENLMLGRRVNVSIPTGGMNAPDVAGTFSIMGQNINKQLLSAGLAGNEGGAATAGIFTSAYGAITEAIGHVPQHIPGPWVTMTKFFNQADPEEQYRRDVLYGSNNRFWDSPYKNFIRPYIHQTISKLTPGEYIPKHVEKQRERDVYLDRIKFLKYAQGGEMGRARRTMVGADMYGDPSMVESALPHRDKPFFEAFRQETDPRARKRILSMVSSDMQRALTGQWSQQYAATQGKAIRQSNNISQAVGMAQSQLRRMGRIVPPSDWSGNNPAIDWEDIKAVMVQHEGVDTHDFNIWDDRTNSLLRKPYVYGAVRELTSRRMPTELVSMSRDLGRTIGATVLPFETFSHNTNIHTTMNNNVNYSAWEQTQYERIRERMLGV